METLLKHLEIARMIDRLDNEGLSLTLKERMRVTKREHLCWLRSNLGRNNSVYPFANSFTDEKLASPTWMPGYYPEAGRMLSDSLQAKKKFFALIISPNSSRAIVGGISALQSSRSQVKKGTETTLSGFPDAIHSGLSIMRSFDPPCKPNIKWQAEPPDSQS